MAALAFRYYKIQFLPGLHWGSLLHSLRPPSRLGRGILPLYSPPPSTFGAEARPSVTLLPTFQMLPPPMPTTHSEIYRGVLFAVVTMVERSDGPCRLRDSDDGDVIFFILSEYSG